MSQIKQKVVVGLGKTGLSCARFLLQQGVSVAVTDSRIHPPGLDRLLMDYPAVTVSVGKFDSDLMAGAEELVVSPGVSLKENAVKKAVDSGVPAIGDIELFCRHLQTNANSGRVVAITGSNAKSTVTTLVGDMIRQAGYSVVVAGNIGLPVMDVLLNDKPLSDKSLKNELLQGRHVDFYVLELSSFQLETTHTLNASVATILNVSPDHLDRYEGIADYIAAKQRIYNACDVAVVNADDQKTYPVAASNSIDPKELVTFSSKSLLYTSSPQQADSSVYQCRRVNADDGIYRDDALVIAVNDMALTGGHNVQNSLAALTIGNTIGLPDESMANTLRIFSGLAHRCQVIGQFDGVTWINDSKGTNTGATIAALNGLGPCYQVGIVLIAGGVGKGADFSELKNAVTQYVTACVLIGDDASLIEEALSSACEIHHAETLDSAVIKSRKLAKPGGVVLLSPACASFDMFTGFEDRGNQFITAVEGGLVCG